jgi:cytoskeleton protein RodZ
MQVSSDSLGSYLRDEREQRGVSLQEISAMTKIQVRFLHALEEDAYDRLPAPPFVVGFLRAYAQCLCLDANEIVAVYHQYYRVRDRPESSQLLPTPPMRQTTRVGVIGAGAVVVLLGLTAVLMLREMRVGSQPRRSPSTPLATRDQIAATGTSVSTPVPSAPVASGVDVKVPVPEPAQASLAVPLASPPAATPLSPRPLPQAAARVPEAPLPTTSEASSPPLVLQADAVEDTWLRVVIDDKERYALLLKAGKSIRWQAGERFVLTVGNAQGTRLLLNGQEVALPSAQSNVVRDFLLTREFLH